MGKAFIQESTLTGIANAIRTKSSSANTYLPSQMAQAILDIPSGGQQQYNVLCFTAVQANSTVYIQCHADLGTINLQYSYDNTNWTNWTSTVSGDYNRFSTITLSNVGDKVYIRGSNATMGNSGTVYSRFFMTGKIAASGSVQSLLTYEGDQLSVPRYCFAYLFSSCTSLTTAPLLQATQISDGCYYNMFYGCTSLTTAPALPATIVYGYSYYWMFYGCTSLTTAPALPATQIQSQCYQSMFYGCTNLTTAPAILPATQLYGNCYQSMFQNCTSLTTAPALPAMSLHSYCYSSMFCGCTSLITAPELPADTLVNYCYQYMFRDCTSLTTAPSILPALSLVNSCYDSMFQNCTSLTTAPELPAETLTNSNCYNYMFNGCTRLNYIKVGAKSWNSSYAGSWVQNVAPTGTFIKPANTSIITGTSGIPTGWNTYDFDVTYNYSTKYLTITTTLPNVSIYYTMDGTTPTTSSTQYTQPVFIDVTDYNVYGYYGIKLKILIYSSSISFITEKDIDNLFYIEAITASTVKYNNQNSNAFKYSNDGITWTIYTNNSQISIAAGSKLFFKKYNYKSYISAQANSSYKFTITGSVNVGGCISIMSHGESKKGIYSRTPTSNYVEGAYLFYNCTQLVSAEYLILNSNNGNSTTYSNNYANMFYGCSNLTKPPKIVITTVETSCYNNMFRGCTSLTTAPELPANTLMNNCYNYMFNGCTRLNYIKVGATSWTTSYANNWVNGVASTGTFVKPSGTSIPTGKSGIPSGWTVQNI